MAYHDEILWTVDVKTIEHSDMITFLRNKSEVAGEFKIQLFFILA